ncbi:MAG TPA: aminoacetone oxidase family FAD-binding enzyme [Ruminococcus flavefaciens]|nr:aminoacetone oxidase family FAD-binding enzyme [Ruminococcus flavefaciens]HQM00022.1 aminoacetone oxidase family FAD-binding enzyme [Ruminococcus flavefaciens]
MYDIAVIGGGASGFAAAVSAKQTDGQLSVIILEKMFRSGKKLAATGNGKCNLSNTNITSGNYHGSIDAMEIISKTPDAMNYFRDTYGVLCVTGSEGRNGGLYPRSNSANTVLSAVRLKIQSLGIEERCDFDVTKIGRIKNGYKLYSKNGEVECRRVIIACGGYAGPAFGTDGGMLRLLRDMGLNSAKICPAVAPLRVTPESVKGLKGVRIKGEVSAFSDGKLLRKEAGEIQFNENNLSGICVFNLAYLFQQYEGRLTLRADLFPQITENDLYEYLADNVRIDRGDYPLEEFLTGIFVKNLAIYLVKKAVGRSLDDKIKSLKNGEIRRIAGLIKFLEFEVTGCSPWQNAQVTMGGITAECVNGKLETLKYKGMYLCGEILDVAGDCGGYNLQWAWSSGIWSGRNCALSLKG